MGHRLLACLSAAVIGLVCAAPASAAGYVSPFAAPDYYVGRTDMGVDVCLAAGDPILAVGDGVVVGVQHDWFEKQPYIWYELTDGPDAGQFVYVAEQIDHLARLGQHLSAGQPVARYARKGTCIETGWSAANGETLAEATTGYTEGQVTQAGISFARFLIAQGVQGTFELRAPPVRSARGKNSRRHQTTTHKPATPVHRHAAKQAAPPRPSGGSATVPGAWGRPSGGSSPSAGVSFTPQTSSGGGGI